MQAHTEILECCKCHRKIVLIRVLFGSNHTASSQVTCWDCLNAKEKADAEKWVEEGGPEVRTRVICSGCGEEIPKSEMASHTCLAKKS